MNKKVLVLPIVFLLCLGAVFAMYGGLATFVGRLYGNDASDLDINCVGETDFGVNFIEEGSVFYKINGSSEVYELNDYCTAGGSIAESYCSYGVYPIYELRSCSEMGFDGCSNGACIHNESSWCEDTDGGIVVDVAGTVYGVNESGNYTYDDYCIGSNEITEYYCSDDEMSARFSSCSSYGFDGCREGACYNETFSWTEVMAFPLNQSNSTNKTS